MSLWTPYIQEEPLDLTKFNKKPDDRVPPLIIHQPALTHETWHHEPAYTQPVYAQPVTSPQSYRDMSSPASINSLDAASLTEDPEYQQFERNALQAMSQNGGLVNNNPRMRREIHSTQAGDDQYRQQRKKNNMAAKMSRDRRKIKEVRLSIQVAYLSRKLVELQDRLADCVCVKRPCYRDLYSSQ